MSKTFLSLTHARAVRETFLDAAVLEGLITEDHAERWARNACNITKEKEMMASAKTI